MDYIFKDWEKKLKAMADSVEKDLKEIRKCKADIQQLKIDVVAEAQKGRYVRDNEQLIISAPRIILGNVDRNGTLMPGASEIVIRGTQVGVEAAGEAGQVAMRAASIRQTAEDPGVDGLEHVVGDLSEVVSQARSIVIQSNDATGVFAEGPTAAASSGVTIHSDGMLKIDSSVGAESRETQLEAQIKLLESRKTMLKKTADTYKESFGKITEDLEKIIEKREKLATDDDIHPNMRFVTNKFIAQLQCNKMLLDYQDKQKRSWLIDHEEFTKQLLDKIQSSDIYNEYMTKKDTSFEDDREFWRALYKSFINKNVELEDLLEEMSLYWNDDKEIVDTFVLKTINRFDGINGADQQLLPEFKDEDDRTFAVRLLRRSVLNCEEYRHLVSESTRNWDINRVAFMDVVVKAHLVFPFFDTRFRQGRTT